MVETNVPLPLLPAHIEETIRSIARLHAEHHQNAMPLQRAVDRITALLGRPRFIGVLTAIAAGWIFKCESLRKTRQVELLKAELEHRVQERTALARANAVLEQRRGAHARARESFGSGP